MADIKLSDALALYRTPAKDEFPAINLDDAAFVYD